MEIELVCLANSRLREGRSIAGLRTDGGGWIRLVGRNGPLERKVYTMEEGREVGLLDVVLAQVIGTQSVNNQPENHLATGPQPGIMGMVRDTIFGSKRWKSTGQVEPANAPGVLDSLNRQGPGLFGSQRDREDLSEFDRRSAMNSLTLVEPDSPVWEVISSFCGQGNERQIRARFNLDGADYSLPVTDPAWEERCDWLGFGFHDNSKIEVKETDRVLLTVSLDEPTFATNPAGECFKSVVGVILLPGAKVGGTKTQAEPEVERK